MKAAVSECGAQWISESLLAMPEEGERGVLIWGHVHERPSTPHHDRIVRALTVPLGRWLLGEEPPRQPPPGGRLYRGTRVLLRRDPNVAVEPALAYATDLRPAAGTIDLLAGPLVLAVEILAPKDTHGAIVELIEDYLRAGTVTWLVDPDLYTVLVFRPRRELEMFTRSQELTTEPELPGFRVPVARLFGS